MTAVWAHRGVPGPAIENTIEAFSSARRLGAHAVELDVRRSAEGHLVVHHDPVVEGVGPVSELTLLRLPPYVPTLAQALTACRGLSVNVEIKNFRWEPGYESDHAIARDTVRVIDEAGHDGSVVVSSFCDRTIDAVRACAPHLSVGWLLGPLTPNASVIPEAAHRGYQAVHPYFAGVDRGTVHSARDLGLSVHVWTARGAAEFCRMAALGVDAVITDEVPVVMDLVRRTRWDTGEGAGAPSDPRPAYPEWRDVASS
jgi:glycerophosphoryl diester phosphodiesterase